VLITQNVGFLLLFFGVWSGVKGNLMNSLGKNYFDDFLICAGHSQPQMRYLQDESIYYYTFAPTSINITKLLKKISPRIKNQSMKL